MTGEVERLHPDPARQAKGRESDTWRQFKVFSPVNMGSQPKGVVDTRWVLTWEEAEGAGTVKAQLVATGYQVPDLPNGNMDIAGCVSRRLPHLQLISLSALEK